MIFEEAGLSFELLDVLYIKQEAVSMFNTGRNFDAISYRIHADARLKTETQEVALSDGAICFVPAQLDYARTAEHDEMIIVHLNLFGISEHRIESFVPSDTERMESLFREMLSIWEEKLPGYRYTATSLFAEILKTCYLQNASERVPNPKIKRAVAYMKEHLADPELTVRDCAAASFISEVYFRRLFRAAYGCAPQAYLIGLRIARAVGLMSSGYYSIKEVATLSGYRDYKYFSTEFKRIKGVSPSEYLYNYKE